MNWKILIPIVVSILIIGITGIFSIFAPEFMADRAEFLEPIVYSSFFNELRGSWGVDQDESFIAEYQLTDLEDGEFRQLDTSQIEKMTEQLTKSLLKEKEKRVALASAKNRDIMDLIRGQLKEKLPKGWRLTRSTSEIDAIVTGNLFVNQWKEPRALFLFFTNTVGRAKDVPREVLGATSNYEDPNITAASEALAKNLSEDQKNLKVALINTGESRLVTTSILEEMVNATTLTFLDKSDTDEYDTELRKALREDGDQRVPLDRLAENFKESTRANAVLIIKESSNEHFYLELVELPSLDILAIGRSAERPFSITIDMLGKPVQMTNPNGTVIKVDGKSSFSGLKALTWEKISDLKVQKGVEFRVEVRPDTPYTPTKENEFIHFTHTTGSSKDWKLEDEDGIERIYRHKTHFQIERSIKAKDDHTEYYYNWVE